MPSRKSDPARRSDATTSVATFAPIEDDSPAPSTAPPAATTIAPATATAKAAASPTVSPPAPSSAGLARPAMDTSMPPPSLPPPGLAQTPEAVILPRPGSASAASLPSYAAGPSQSTPSEKSKDDEKKSGGGHPKEAVTIPIEELQLPKSIITRLAKGVLPPNTQIQANAILAMTKSATVFINHLANAANEVTSLQNKKTIMPADVFRALDDIEFGFMRERVEAEFSKFNETQTTKRSAYRKKVSAAKKAAKVPGEADADGDADASMAGTEGDNATAGGAAVAAADTTAGSGAGSGSASASAGGGGHRSKKARTDGTSNDDKMDVDDVEDASDPESVPDEDEDLEDEAPEEEDDEEEEDGHGENDEERDELEEREDRPDEDEALDDGNNSD
ncbi:hypothetical protein VPNG_09712 [Cytospora leucostoma]|uniref:DNA polymerase epsilon subunit D n=1 Tax=Cytospora leucostoma TaxID=1230097 RepID=A0A423VJV1_9PEZI|nr:hypothetical protein VPNG_09712 [Cytospora leucostoma]